MCAFSARCSAPAKDPPLEDDSVVCGDTVACLVIDGTGVDSIANGYTIHELFRQ